MHESDKSHETIGNHGNRRRGLREAIEQVFTDSESTLRLSREMAAENPDYAEEARKIAFDLFPDDASQREAFLSGSELPFAIQRQVQGADELRTMVEGSAQETKPKKRWLRRRRRESTRGRTAAVVGLGFIALPTLGRNKNLPKDF